MLFESSECTFILRVLHSINSFNIFSRSMVSLAVSIIKCEKLQQFLYIFIRKLQQKLLLEPDRMIFTLMSVIEIKLFYKKNLLKYRHESVNALVQLRWTVLSIALGLNKAHARHKLYNIYQFACKRMIGHCSKLQGINPIFVTNKFTSIVTRMFINKMSERWLIQDSRKISRGQFTTMYIRHSYISIVTSCEYFLSVSVDILNIWFKLRIWLFSAFKNTCSINSISLEN